MKFKFINQLESNDCGPACLAMVSHFHGKEVALKDVKEHCSVTRMGVSIKDILQGGKSLGFSSHGVKLILSDLEKIPLPTILFWKQDHYVVLFKIKKKKSTTIYSIADPGYGKTNINEEILEKEWIGNNPKGVCLLFEPGPNFSKEVPTKSKKQPNEVIQQLTDFASKNKLRYTLSFILLIIGLATNWVIPIIFQKVIDDGIISKSLNLVVVLLLAQLILFVGSFGSRLFSDYLLTLFNFKLSISFKENFLFKLMKLPINYFDTRLNTDTLTRLSDLSSLQTFLTWKGISFIINILNIIVFSLILLYLNWWVFTIFLVLSAISIGWISIFLKRRAVLEYSMFIQQSENNNNLYEFVMNMPEIKVNRAENTIISRITSIQEKLNALELNSLFLNMYQLSGANFILKFKELTVIAICAYLIINSQMTVGTLLSITYILGQLNGPIINLINNIQDVQDVQIAHKRIDDVYKVKNEENFYDKQSIGSLENVVLENVSFKYPGSFNPFVLRNLSFEIKKNKITAIVGTSGSGKTTLMKLLMLYYRPNSGSIIMGNQVFGDFQPDEWRNRCGVVLQDGHLFSGSIKYNITLNDKETDKALLEQASKIACIDEFISSLPLGIETKIGNIGLQLSGGQSQRILIARAVYKNPEFIFFDEATSSLDANTEKAIINNLSHFFKGRTVVVVAHRLSTVKNADHIIVIENGELIEEGKHDDLVKSKQNYYSLVKNQLELGT